MRLIYFCFSRNLKSTLCLRPPPWGKRASLYGVLAILAILAGCAGSTKRQHSDASMLQYITPQHRQEVVMTALGLIGSPYRYGGTSPESGFDCSGLVNYVFRTAAGANVPRDTRSQASVSRRVARRNLKAGDLVFFNTLGRRNWHVGIYI